MHAVWHVFLWGIALFVVAIFVVQMVLLTVQLGVAIHKYFFLQELDLTERYGRGTWVVITGASSGQGRQFALQFAKRGFHLVLIGSLRTNVAEIQQLYPETQIRFVAKDFNQAWRDDFFDEIEKTINLLPGEVSVLINSVAHRTGWNPYHEMPVEKIRDTIVTGTLVQARLIHFLLPKLLSSGRPSGKRSLILSVTAQCMHPNFGWGVGLSNEISVPYLTIYEPTNAWGYYNMQSVCAEYEGELDLLNITPGAVRTVNTHEALATTIGAIDDDQYVANIFRLMGNVQGATCAHWAHAATMVAVNLAPWIKDKALRETGERLARTYMRTFKNKSYDIRK